ncbi:coiled-coil and C2 domain-containing protein 1-like isoform X2 [Prorops nasuta]|uniref:coiled-coil and C2 domain-containing protein 1-like isoform X2 n=1 Tax=Prorops nasuta TaxID=863751 RepID=UPI0034CF6191
MFGRKKELLSAKPKRTPDSLEQYGIFQVPTDINEFNNQLGAAEQDDDDLEAELAALTMGEQKPIKRARAKPNNDQNLDAMVAESLKDLDNEDLSGDEDDPELLNELRVISGDEPDEILSEKESVEPVEGQNNDSMHQLYKLLTERLDTYKLAKQKALDQNDGGRARRFGRGIKTLEDLLKDIKAGRSIDESNIPPLLPPSATDDSIRKQPAVNEPALVTPPDEPSENESISVTEQPTEKSPIDEVSFNLLIQRQQEYRLAAVAWKKAGNTEEAVKFAKTAKQFDIVIAAIKNGETVDLSDMPPTPDRPIASMSSASATDKNLENVESKPEAPLIVEKLQGSGSTEDIGDALKERLEVYQRAKVAAENEENSSKARRYGRICKQFEDALKAFARGKPVPFDELPTPPGYAPLSFKKEAVDAPSVTVDEATKDKDEQLPAAPEQTRDRPEAPNDKPPTPPARGNRAKRPKPATSRAEKQTKELLQRQHEFKQAALSAKKDGDMDLARDYLRQSKGLNRLIQASMCGLPVDMNSIPLSPVAKMELTSHNLGPADGDSFTLISSNDCLEEDEASATDEQIYENLEAQLMKQVKWCLTTRDHSKALGDVPGYNRWERLALSYTRDLDMLKIRKRDSLPPPQHHYETKTYAIVQSCTELSDGDIEISIIRGTNYSKEGDTYVIYEFPFPSDNAPTDRTSTVRDTRNPEYNATFLLKGIVDRTSRQCQRVFKRHSLKCQVWAKGGFFRSDTLLGTVSVKLQALETQCTIHDSYKLMDGRKAVGGQLEVKIRLRNPIITKQIEQVTDRWLAIDN